MENINAPELDTPEGVVAKENLEKILKDRIVQCRLGTYDKYGRVLVTILEEDENLKEHLKLHTLKNII
jgi:endonuclease YncB( thermonuclease family)